MRQLEENVIEGSENPEPMVENDEDEDGSMGDDDEVKEEEEDGAEAHQESRAFEDAMLAEIDLIESLANKLGHQIQFQDQRMLMITPCSAKVHHFCDWQSHVWTRRGE